VGVVFEVVMCWLVLLLLGRAGAGLSLLAKVAGALGIGGVVGHHQKCSGGVGFRFWGLPKYLGGTLGGAQGVSWVLEVVRWVVEEACRSLAQKCRQAGKWRGAGCCQGVRVGRLVRGVVMLG
jgi:hypothetical protein